MHEVSVEFLEILRCSSTLHRTNTMDAVEERKSDFIRF